jgi:predicted RNase H-like nuclease (RuvC/YqgF family)
MWDEGGSRGKGMHPSSNDEVNKDLDKRTNEEKYWGIAKTKSRTQTRSEGLPTLGQDIKKENEQLKATSQQLQDEYEETSNKLKKVLRLLQYIRVIKREMKEEASTINIIDPPK